MKIPSSSQIGPTKQVTLPADFQQNQSALVDLSCRTVGWCSSAFQLSLSGTTERWISVNVRWNIQEAKQMHHSIPMHFPIQSIAHESQAFHSGPVPE